MLQTLRDNTGKWFIKILLGAIIASFALWGISDVVRNYFIDHNVAKVGSRSISYEEFTKVMRQEEVRIHSITKGKISSEQLRSEGLHNMVLTKLINQISLEQEVVRLGLAASDNLLRDQIHSMPIFHNNGTFDRERFSNILQSSNINEGEFIQDAKHTLLSQQLVLSLTIGTSLPKFYKNMLYQSIEEKKVFTTVSIPYKQMTISKQTSPEQLQSFYETHKEHYLVPEYRSITWMVFDDTVIGKRIKVTDSDLEKLYETKKEDFSKSETREIRLLSYSDPEKAKKALELLNKGRPIPAVAREVPGGKYEDIGEIDSTSLHPGISDKVFTLEAGKKTIIEDSSGVKIYEVNRINPAKTLSLQEVKEQLTNEIQEQKLAIEIEKIKNEIDDSLASGVPLSEIAKKFELPIESLESVDSHGLDITGKPMLSKLDKELRAAILHKAFEVAEGLDSGFIDIEGKYAFILHVEKVIKSFEPEFASVQAKVRKDWEEQEKKKIAHDLAQNISKEVKNLNDLTQLANKHQLTLTSNHTISRSDLMKENKWREILPDNLLERAFALGKEQAQVGATDSGYTVVMLQKTLPFKAKEEDRDKFIENIDNLLRKDIVTLLMRSLKENHDIRVNQELVNRLYES